MIIVRITGGLGNQMFQYAMAKSMAKKNNDYFKLDISFYQKQSLRKYELNFFNIEENIANKNEYKLLRGDEGFVFKIKNKFCFKIRRPNSYIYEKNLTQFDKEVYDKKNNIYLDGFWQNENYFKNIKDEIINDFTLRYNISIEAKKYLKNIKNNKSVSIHVRRGDYVKNSHTNSIHGTCKFEYYKKAIDYINTKVNDVVFYIFSDDIYWCEKTFDFLENKIFVDDTKSAIDDLELMKNCKHNIIANSTFSWWGAWLNENQNKIVIAPIQWLEVKLDIDIYPKEWILI